MIRKTETGYVMDEVWRPTVTQYSLDKAECLALRIAPDGFMRQCCGSCGRDERGDYYSVRAFSPPDAGKKLDVRICAECAKRWAPELQAEADKKSVEAFDELHPGERARMEAAEKAVPVKLNTRKDLEATGVLDVLPATWAKVLLALYSRRSKDGKVTVSRLDLGKAAGCSGDSTRYATDWAKEYLGIKVLLSGSRLPNIYTLPLKLDLEKINAYIRERGILFAGSPAAAATAGPKV